MTLHEYESEMINEGIEVLPPGIQTTGMCPECGRIGDHQPRCPELEKDE